MHTRQSLWMLLVISAVGCRGAEVYGPAPSKVKDDAPADGMRAGRSSASGDGDKAEPSAATPREMGDATKDEAKPGDAAPGMMPAAAKVDYGKPENWLCRPGHNALCEVDLDTTVVNADGSLEVEKYQAAEDPAIDCFYVYPTVSLDMTPNSDLKPGPEEESVVAAQFARLGTKCRLFAPVYRQITLTALRAATSGTPMTPDREQAYGDALGAWKHYLDNDNKGRGVVLVGHSQGSGVLTRLIREELDKDPLDKRLISAFLLGSNVTVPPGEVVGGTFKNVPLCESQKELGCVISYMSFRDDVPPPESSNFARSMDPMFVAGCTNPAALGGGSAELHSYFRAKGMVGGVAIPAWIDPAKDITTPFVSVPGLISGECTERETGSMYLSITVNGEADDPRTDSIVGDVTTNGEVVEDWGLHLIDVHLAMGNLVDLIDAKAEAYADANE